ncbi:MAG: hypothetical protein SFU25_05590 [Candidatus Caenarcaniphilales bacterium]|nr:hypothetical protein [Candidatus Caenarcaniphilales bacterium]
MLLLCFASWSPCFAGGVGSYTGNIWGLDSALNQANGNTLAGINLGFNINKVVALGVFDSSGSINNPIFANPTTNFPNGSLFPVSGTTLIQAETNLVSKFDLDALNSSADAALIINAMNRTTDINSQDVLIKGAIFTNYPSSTSLRLRTNTNQIVFSGGTGTAPRMALRAIAGVPNVSTTTTTNPQTGLTLNGSRRNANGFARFAIVGDLRESQVNTTTNGNWTANITISLTSL